MGAATASLVAVLLAGMAVVFVDSEAAAGIHHHRHHHRHRAGSRHGHRRHERHRTGGATVGVLAVEPASAAARSAESNGNAHKTDATILANSTIPMVLMVSNATAAGGKRTIVPIPTASAGGEQALRGQLRLNGPLPVDFPQRFAQAVGHASESDPSMVHVVGTLPLDSTSGVVLINFEAAAGVTHSVENQAADPNSHLANGPLRPYLVAKEASSVDQAAWPNEGTSAEQFTAVAASRGDGGAEAIDIDTEMPYGELEPFGREDTAQELTEQSISESDRMVDELERAEVAEEKRAVFRALTRLRGAAIASFDGIARAQTGNIDEYAKVHQWRYTHPLQHLADEEADVSKWAFPDNADF
mmetsp:Transcript_81404/g.226738  ORF Transcript_81404/g.226738 Transcript_81404/m.226738 type:complete len:358 (-) Transcript_81404:168-1241(-)